ncbi:MAG: hypothetical protein ACTSVF_02045, partial [Candidatus Asgardarchaeia archaeon]
KYEAFVRERDFITPSVSYELRKDIVSKERKEEAFERREIPEKEERAIVSDMSIQYPEEVYVGKEDYIMRITFLPKDVKLEVIEEDLKEKKEKIEFLAEEEEPVVEVALSSTAFLFDNPTKVVKLNKSKPSSVSFIISPKEEMTGRRKVNVSVKYKNVTVKEVFITINVKDYLIDSVTFVQVKELKKVSTILSVICTLITIVSFMLGL